MRARDKSTVLERLWDRVTKTSSCWLWEGGKDQGYAVATLNSKKVLGHRLVYETLVGKIPDGMQIDHLCRVRNCVNPEHLEVVTRVENVMRGEGPSAKNARKTHCYDGHEFTPSNTYIRPDKSRECKTCRQRNWINSNEKRRVAKLKLRGALL